MLQVKTYHRPASVDEALQLLNRADVTTAVIAGGTYITTHMDDDIDEVIDLQAAKLDGVQHGDGGQLALGAMARLQSLVDDAKVPDLLRQAIRYEAPNTFRNMSTIGGVVASADWESETLAALLVFDASLTIQTIAGSQQVSLADFLADPAGELDKGLITAIHLSTTGETTHERVARTPMDKPIVAVIGRKTTNEEIKLAICGVAKTPVLCAADQLDSLEPPGDFRGSNAYRKQMAIILSQRVMNTFA